MARSNQITQDVDGPASTTLITAAETVIATLPGISTPGPDAKIILEGAATITGGTAATALQMRVRRGTTAAGAQVGGTVQVPLVAAGLAAASIQVDDNPGDVAGQQYVLTAQQVSATGNGTAAGANLSATV